MDSLHYFSFNMPLSGQKNPEWRIGTVTLEPNPVINRDEEIKKNWEEGEKEWQAYEIQREKERQNFLHLFTFQTPTQRVGIF